MSEQRYIDAIRTALDEAMAADEAVVLLGEDLTVGGPFGATKGLVERYGERRVRNTPISEGTVVGLSVGAALAGLRPVVEVMFVDFITLAMDQLVNHAAKLHFMSGGQLRVPLTIRAQYGAVGGFGAHHSQSLEAWLVHVPGLKVVAPSTPADARGLLLSAIRDDNPVVFLEHRGLYFTRDDVPDGLEVPIGKATVRRRGGDVTLVAVGRLVGSALQAAEVLAAEGIEVEVIDPRSLLPLDVPVIVESVRRTGRLVVAHEAVETGGIGGEIAAAVQSAAHDALHEPIARVGAPFVPVPAAPELEQAFVPSVDRIAEVVRSLARRAKAASH